MAVEGTPNDHDTVITLLCHDAMLHLTHYERDIHLCCCFQRNLDGSYSVVCFRHFSAVTIKTSFLISLKFLCYSVIVSIEFQKYPSPQRFYDDNFTIPKCCEDLDIIQPKATPNLVTAGNGEDDQLAKELQYALSLVTLVLRCHFVRLPITC